MVLEHGGEHDSQWAAIRSIAGKIGCTPETLRRWVRQTEINEGSRPGVTTAEAERIKKLAPDQRAALTKAKDDAKRRLSGVSTAADLSAEAPPF